MQAEGHKSKASNAKYNNIPRIHGQKSRANYVSPNGALRESLHSRNFFCKSSSSLGAKGSFYRMKSTGGDQPECDLNMDSLDQLDDLSQFSMNIPQGNTKENDLLSKTQNNSINMRSESGCTNLRSNEKLDYSCRGLVKLPSHELSSKLRYVKLSNNSLKKFPEKLCDLIFLKSLYVDNNQIENLPTSIRKLTRLKVLDVHSNCIEEIPKEIGECISLKKISIKENKFTSIPSSMGKLENLAVLDIEWFKYCIPPIRIAEKTGKIRQESMEPCIAKFKELCNMFDGCGNPTLSAFLIYFSQDSDLKSGKEPDYNRQDNRKRTILHRAATAGHVGVVKGLLNIESIDPNKLEKDQCTPLGLALRDDHEEIANILIEKEKVDVNLGGGSFGAPIHIAVSRNKTNTINKLIMRDVDINKVDFKLQTPLHIIMDVFSRNVEMAEEITRMLVFNGAKPNIKDSEQLTPLHHAVTKRHHKGVELICKLNKNLNARKKEIFNLNSTGGDKAFTAIYYALERRLIPTAEMLFLNGARVCLRFHNKYEPKEWKKTETSVRRHILWKMEKFELDLRCNRIKMTPKKMNDPNTVRSVEGEVENCFNDYTNVGDYLCKYRHIYQKNFKRKKWYFHKKDGIKSQQKILFTYNNPGIKKGDAEVEDINVDSDIENEEDRTSVCSERPARVIAGSMARNHNISNSEAFSIPESMSVNNDNHFKGPNIFLLRDQILSTTNECPNIALDAIQKLFLTDFDRTLKVNFKSVLKDIAKGLNLIKFQRAVIKTLDLLRVKGTEEIAGILESHLKKPGGKRDLSEVFAEFEERSLLRNPYTQRCLRACIKEIKDRCSNSKKYERRPYQHTLSQRKGSRKAHTRSANRILKMPVMATKFSEDVAKLNSMRKLRKKKIDLGSTMKLMSTGRNPFLQELSSVNGTTNCNNGDSSEIISMGCQQKGEHKKYLPPKGNYGGRKKRTQHARPPHSNNTFKNKPIMNNFRSNYIH
ncbi:unnamed protein product [Moneuplotes crassus]|uniref:Disease resistance R13L4/SHOC-2-like LRR domain-containing protein n=1 Tax=Euplotes crassus TaxID=5936 RepID=A0AAD1XYF5_EUPCR|nr:unnamed protein product [Moneuplotes crassus]